MKMIEIWLCAAGGLAAALAGCGGGNDACDPDAPGTICTVAGVGEYGLPLEDGPALQVGLSIPLDVAISPDGELWIADMANFAVRAVDARGQLRTAAGSGILGSDTAAAVGVPALEAQLQHPSDLAFRDGYLYVALWHGGRIKRVRLSDMTVEHFAGRGERLVYDGDGGPALGAGFDTPVGIAFAPGGELSIMDQQNQVIRQVDRAGRVRTIAGHCVLDHAEACTAGEQPAACPGSHRTTCGDPANCPAPCSPGFSGDGGPATAARMAQPYGGPTDTSGHLAYDAAGNLYFADSDNHRIRRVDTTGVITTIAGTGEPGAGGDGGPATAAQLHYPVDLAIADDGTIYFTDTYNNCVRKIDPAGTIHRVAGQCGEAAVSRGFSGDGGPPLEALLARPFGVHLAGAKLYVSDSFNHRVRVVNLSR